MLNYVTITSQGQITIPANLRKLLGLKKATKAIVDIEDNKLLIKPVKSLMDLEGALQHRVKKLSTKEIRKKEKNAWSEALKDKYKPR